MNDNRTLFLGLDKAGTTTIFYTLVKKIAPPIPARGFSLEVLQTKKFETVMWDLGGIKENRPFWRHYYQHTRLVVFVVDCADRRRIPRAASELHRFLGARDLQEVPFVIVANKQDLEGAMEPEELPIALGIASKEQIRNFRLRYFQWLQDILGVNVVDLVLEFLLPDGVQLGELGYQGELHVVPCIATNPATVSPLLELMNNILPFHDSNKGLTPLEICMGCCYISILCIFCPCCCPFLVLKKPGAETFL